MEFQPLEMHHLPRKTSRLKSAPGRMIFLITYLDLLLLFEHGIRTNQRQQARYMHEHLVSIYTACNMNIINNYPQGDQLDFGELNLMPSTNQFEAVGGVFDFQAPSHPQTLFSGPPVYTDFGLLEEVGNNTINMWSGAPSGFE